MTTKRLETLVDGIFAIAMTILVLSIEVPDIPDSLTESAFFRELSGLGPKLWVYALSFWILSVFWQVNHQQFNSIVRCDSGLISINIFWLMCIALVPFSSELIGEHGNYFTSNAVFHLNLFCASFLYYLNWRYAENKGLVDSALNPDAIRNMRRSNLIFPALAFLALCLSWFVQSWSSLVYIAAVLYKERSEKVRSNN